MSDSSMRKEDVYVVAKLGALIQGLMAAGVLSKEGVEAITKATLQIQMALTWLGNALADAQKVAAADPMQDPSAWLHAARSSLLALGGAVDMLKQTGIIDTLGASKTHDLGWLETLLEKQASETRVLEQIVKISG